MSNERQRSLFHDLPEPMGRWIHAQQVALLAAILANKSPTLNQQGSLLRLVSLDCDLTDTEGRQRYISHLRTLPPNALEALCSLIFPSDNEHHNWHIHRPLWNQTLKTLKWDGGRSLFAGAKLIGNRILAGTLGPAQLISAAKNELGCDWYVQQAHAPLKALIKKLDPDLGMSNNTDVRIEALYEFRRSVHLPRWELVENAILQQSFAWPLLVFPNEQSAGLTLPIAIDISLETAVSPRFRSLGIIDYSEWEKPLERKLQSEILHRPRSGEFSSPVQRAVEAARALWLSEHGSWPDEFKNAIKNASITIDVTRADLIVGPILKEFRVRGDSLENYLSIVVLAHLLGRTAIAAVETTCATGMLSDELRDHNGGDWILDLPGGIDTKISHAEKTFFFDRILIPGEKGRVVRRGHLEVCEGELLSDFAAYAFGQAWRRHRYVRCPDVAHAFRPSDRRRPDDPQVNDILWRLRNNRSPVIEFEAGIKPSNVARALYRVNGMVAKSAEDEGKVAYDQLGSFAFVRLEENEINERFWQVIWDLVNGQSSSFFDFRFAVSRSIPGQLLARELNRFSPTTETPRRAPDVIVLFGTEYQNDLYDPDVPHAPFSRLHFAHLKRTLNNALNQTSIDRISTRIGKTRIILVHDGEDDPPQIIDPAEIEIALQDPISKLSIFRHGFSRQMAHQILAGSNNDFEHALSKLVEEGYLIFADRAGEFFLKARLPLPTDKKMLADLHFSAANSIAGFLAQETRDSQFDYRQAFRPERSHEAQWHLHQASLLYGGGKNRARKAQDRLSQLSEPFGWTRIRRAVVSREGGIQLLEALNEILQELDSRKGQEWELHPIELAWTAKLVFRLDRENRDDLDYCNRRKLLPLNWLTLLNRAEGAAYRFYDEEREVSLYIVTTTRSCLLLSENPNNDGVVKASRYVKLAINANQFTPKILDPEWFEFMGDRIFGNHQSAAMRATAAYREGILNKAVPVTANPSVSILSKYIAAAHFAEISPAQEVLDFIKQLPLKAQAFIEKYSQVPTEGLWELPHVVERWQIGREKIITDILQRPLRTQTPVTARRPSQTHNKSRGQS